MSRVDSWIRVCEAKMIAPGEDSVLYVAPPVAVCNIDGDFYATDDTCTHENYSLSEG